MIFASRCLVKSIDGSVGRNGEEEVIVKGMNVNHYNGYYM